MPLAADRVGIVGPTGFIGSALVADFLADGAGRPRLFGRRPSVLGGQTVEPLTLTASLFKGLDCVVHLSGITTSRASEAELQRVNVDLAVDVARAAAAAGVKRLIFISSLHVHGKAAAGRVGPDAPLQADNAYGRSKAAAELALGRVAAETGLSLTILRPPMVYGPGSKGSFRLLANLVRTGLPVPFGRARAKRSFCSVGNLVSAIRYAVAAPKPPQVLIPADPEDFDTPGLVRAMAAGSGRRTRLWSIPKGMLHVPLALVGRGEMITSLFEPLRIDRSHWADWGWQPVESGVSAVRAAVAPPRLQPPLILYVTNSTPYFFSHRLALAREAIRRGFRVGLVGGDVGEHGEALAAEGILSFEVPGGERGMDPVGDLRAGLALADHIRRLNPVSVHASGLKTIFLCAIAGFRTRLPQVVCLITGLGSVYINDTARVRVVRWGIETVVRPLLRRGGTTVVFQNGDDRAYFLERGMARQDNSLIIKGSGVDTVEYALTPEPVSKPPLVVFPARLLKSKGVCEFAEAAAIIAGRGVAARFALVGDLDPSNPDALSADELSEIVRGGHVEAWGYRADMASVFAGCHLVCLPSYREGVPKALIEAAAVGRAIVSTDVPGCREIVIDGQNGLLAPPRAAEALAEAIEALLLDDERRQAMGLVGRAMVEAEFSQDVVVRALADIYGKSAPELLIPA